MNPDLKAVVEELVALWSSAVAYEADAEAAAMQIAQAFPSLLAELRRLWAIEEAAVRYREANEAIYNTEEAKRWDAEMEEVSKKLALFASLPPRKPSGGAEAKP